jgi:hypothetical protein
MKCSTRNTPSFLKMPSENTIDFHFQLSIVATWPWKRLFVHKFCRRLEAHQMAVAGVCVTHAPHGPVQSSPPMQFDDSFVAFRPNKSGQYEFVHKFPRGRYRRTTVLLVEHTECNRTTCTSMTLKERTICHLPRASLLRQCHRTRELKSLRRRPSSASPLPSAWWIQLLRWRSP